MKKARLVALQIQMLPTGQQLLNLNKEQVSKFIIKHEKFWEVIYFFNRTGYFEILKKIILNVKDTCLDFVST